MPGTGPVVADPVRTAADVAAVRRLEAADVADIAVSVRQLVAELGDMPLIGFAGAPFTLASYLIEGGPSKDHDRTKALMYCDPAVWHALLGRLAEISATFLRVQVDAGASRCSCSTRGSAGCRRPTTPSTCCRTRRRSSPRWPTTGCR